MLLCDLGENKGMCVCAQTWAQTETQELPSKHQETLFYCEGKLVAQRGCGFFVMRVFSLLIQKKYPKKPYML